MKSSAEKTSAAAAFPVYHDWEVAAEVKDPCYDHVDLSFENTEEAYKSKTNFDIVRALLVFNLCSIKPLVAKNKEVGFFVCWMRVARMSLS